MPNPIRLRPLGQPETSKIGEAAASSRNTAIPVCWLGVSFCETAKSTALGDDFYLLLMGLKVSLNCQAGSGKEREKEVCSICSGTGLTRSLSRAGSAHFSSAVTDTGSQLSVEPGMGEGGVMSKAN